MIDWLVFIFTALMQIPNEPIAEEPIVYPDNGYGFYVDIEEDYYYGRYRY